MVAAVPGSDACAEKASAARFALAIFTRHLGNNVYDRSERLNRIDVTC